MPFDMGNMLAVLSNGYFRELINKDIDLLIIKLERPERHNEVRCNVNKAKK